VLRLLLPSLDLIKPLSNPVITAMAATTDFEFAEWQNSSAAMTTRRREIVLFASRFQHSDHHFLLLIQYHYRSLFQRDAAAMYRLTSMAASRLKAWGEKSIQPGSSSTPRPDTTSEMAKTNRGGFARRRRSVCV